ncbi:MAG: peptide ABC transporter substrate-binding protein [Silvanigrellales bacterium]|nr:peptide ABC transporter substrate-binding protein [Silvanigrellales bacterium]
MKNRVRLIVSGLLLCSGAAFAAAPGTLTEAELRIGTTQEFENLNPLVSNMSATSYILGAVNRTGLVILDDKNRWVAQAAERVPSLENGDAVFFQDASKKKLKVTWRIRKDAVWADGKPIVASDYELAWKVGLADTVSVPNREPYQNVERFDIDAKNPKVFTVTFTEPKFTFARGLWSALPSHVEGKVFKEWGDKPQGYDRNTSYARTATTPALYSGPYRLSAIKLGSHVELVRNEKWWGKAAAFKKIVVRVIPNSGTLESNLVSGEIDVVNGIGMSLDQALAFETRVKSEKLPFQVVYGDGLTYEHIDLDLENPLLKDVRVRQALLHAIDREALVKALFAGKQRVAHHFLHFTDPWFTDAPADVTKYEFSPRKARKLLAEAGFKAGPAGVLEKDGKPLRFPFMTTAGNKVRENVQAFVKESLKQVGVDAEIRNEPAKVFFGETTTKRKFGGMAMYAWVSSPELTPRQTLHSSSIPTAENGWAGTNTMAWRNAAADAAIDGLEQEFSLAERKKKAAVVVREYTRELPVLPLFYRATIVVSAASLEGMTPTPHTFAETYHIERWRPAVGARSGK